jgi:hypothetical protein
MAAEVFCTCQTSDYRGLTPSQLPLAASPIEFGHCWGGRRTHPAGFLAAETLGCLDQIVAARATLVDLRRRWLGAAQWLQWCSRWRQHRARPVAGQPWVARALGVERHLGRGRSHEQNQDQQAPPDSPTAAGAMVQFNCVSGDSEQLL